MDERLLETWVDLREQIILFLPQLLAGLLTFIGFWIAARLVSWFIRRALGRTRVDREIQKLTASVANAAVLVFGLVTALGTMGIDIGALIAGLGLTGFALGFALQDIVANTLAGFLLLLYKPFNNGDRIKVGGWEGYVDDVDLRYTTIDTGKDLILIPNKKLFEEAITVYDKGGKVKRVTITGEATGAEKP